MPTVVPGPRTLYDKIWDDHVVYALSYPLDDHIFIHKTAK